MTGDEVLRTTLLTLKVGAVATAAIAPPGVWLGYLLARREFRAKPLVQTLVAMPMVLPPVAVGLILLLLLGRRGPVGHTLHLWWGLDIIFTWWAAALAAAVMSFPLLVRTCEAAFAEVPVRYEQVAYTLGASRVGTFFRVTLPLARRGILYGMLLAFSRGLGEFGATSMIAGNIPGRTSTLALQIFNKVQNQRDHEALVLMGVSVLLAFISTLVAEIYLSRRGAVAAGGRRAS